MSFKILLRRITPALRAIAKRHLLYGFYDENDLYQEMCLFLWKRFGETMPIGLNDSYIIKACEFHILNYLRKGRPKAKIVSMDEIITEDGFKLEDILSDKKTAYLSNIDQSLTLNDIKNADLTSKEKNVLSLLLKGHTVREAAKELGISHVMVVKYKKNIIKKCHKKGYQ